MSGNLRSAWLFNRLPPLALALACVVLAGCTETQSCDGFDEGTAGDLSNGTDDLTLSCSGNVLDTVAWDNGATFPNPIGSSIALCPDKFSKEANDLGANWSTSSQPWSGGDNGSPGAANPQCLP
jgi:hypothetical protein